MFEWQKICYKIAVLVWDENLQQFCLLTDYLCTTFLSNVLIFMFTQMQMQTIAYYGYIYDSIFITNFFKIKHELYSPKVSPQPPVKNSGYAPGWTQSNHWPWEVNTAIKLWIKNI